jgi:4-hydroxybenzoate polyprenyltransferase
MPSDRSLRARLIAYLQLVRPANVVTAWADVLAGFAVAGAAITLSGATTPVPWSALGWLLVATTGLYSGGIVLNDVFDAELDAQERPERPIPSARASRRGAIWLGGVLLVGGIAAAGQVRLTSGALAALVAGGAVLYDAKAKHHTVFGPLVMGTCRGGNLLLGVSAVPAMMVSSWYLALLPIAYIAAITTISQGEVHGGTSRTGYGALGLVLGVIASLLTLGMRVDYRVLHALSFIFVLAVQVVPPFGRAARTPSPDLIRAAVKAGVMALIPLNAALAAGFGGWVYGALVLLLLPLSMGLGRLFAVT